MARLRLKQAVAQDLEEVPEDEDEGVDNIWVAYTVDVPNKEAIAPLLKNAQAMIDPRQPNSYYIKYTSCARFCDALGPGWIVENNAITRQLPFAIEWEYKHLKHDKEMFTRLRKYLTGIPNDTIAGIKGIHFFSEGKKPDELKPGWLYVGLQNHSSCGYATGLYYQTEVTPENYKVEYKTVPLRMPKRGIQDRNKRVDFATYAQQTIYCRMYSSTYYMADVAYEAILQGAQLAMKHVGGATAQGDWLAEGVAKHTERKAEKIAANQKLLDQHIADVGTLAEKIKATSILIEELEENIFALNRKITPDSILLQYPSLAHVQHVNTDDPNTTVIQTSPLTINGVLLGEYTLTFRHDQMRVHIKSKNEVAGIYHPNLYIEDKKIKWDIRPDQLKKLIESLAAGNMHTAVSLALDSLINVAKDGPSAERLAKMDQAIKQEAEKPKRGRPKKAQLLNETKALETVKENVL